MHSHLIPGIDDGVKTIEESMSLIAKFKDLGYSKLITTPHVMSDYYKNSPDIINKGLSKVKDEINKQEIEIEIEAAAEYYIDFDFLEKIKNKEYLTISNRYVLIEFSFFNAPETLSEVIFELQTNGNKVILAHPERFTFFHNKKENYEILRDKDVYFQLNANSLIGEYSPGVKKVAEWLIEKEFVNFVGSDAHNLQHLEKMRSLLYNKSFYNLVKSGALLNSSL